VNTTISPLKFDILSVPNEKVGNILRLRFALMVIFTCHHSIECICMLVLMVIGWFLFGFRAPLLILDVADWIQNLLHQGVNIR